MSFDCYEVALELVRGMPGIVAAIEAKDRPLADQVRRAVQSVVLNIAEARRRAGKDRRHLFRVARGSGAEVRAALEIARAWRYVDEDACTDSLELLDRVMAMLWRLVA